MAEAKRPKTGRAQRRDADVIRTSEPSAQERNKLRIKRLTRICEGEYINAALGVKSGYQTFGIETGDATYRALTWAIACDAPIAGVTVPSGSRHYVMRDQLVNYLETVRLVLDGEIVREMSTGELMQVNEYQGITFGPFYTGFAFPGHIYDDVTHRDAYSLGTQNLQSATLEIRLGADFDADNMELVVMPHAADIPRPVSFMFRNQRLNTTFTGAGRHTYKDLPTSDDLSSVWLKGDGIEKVQMRVDGDLLFDMDRAQYDAFLISQGKDPSRIDGWFLDFHAGGVPTSLAALDLPGERRRNAAYVLNITTSNETTPVEFLCTHADLWGALR